MEPVMRRRDLLIGVGAAALPLPAIAQNAETRVLRFVPLANLTVLDPILTTGELIFEAW
jgi:peptide/nickel transport system substrate-binding protein